MNLHGPDNLFSAYVSALNTYVNKTHKENIIWVF